MSYGGVRFLEDLGDEFARIAVEPGGSATLQSWRRARRVRPLLAAAIALALAAGAVAAVVVSDNDQDTTGLRTAKDRLTVAEGVTVGGSPWLLTVGTKTAGIDRPSFCVSLRVTGDRGPEASIRCGPVAPGQFSGGLAESGSSQPGLVFGMAPDAAATVTVDEGRSSTTAQTIDDDAGLPGRFYVVEAGGDYRETTISFRDERGRELRPPEPITEFLRRTAGSAR